MNYSFEKITLFNYKNFTKHERSMTQTVKCRSFNTANIELPTIVLSTLVECRLRNLDLSSSFFSDGSEFLGMFEGKTLTYNSELQINRGRRDIFHITPLNHRTSVA